ncbi:hypothetical protein NDU88_006873 [Pleurodeles waltl]|uniref:Uncharacterized protein n=1 Tax=Pleurodeles waltl TaxID=8319 RepID=A0AAV7TYU9_PLEWA|nr:hypothetical protein NDU88_006873 [Pleurodeles waltl]
MIHKEPLKRVQLSTGSQSYLGLGRDCDQLSSGSISGKELSDLREEEVWSGARQSLLLGVDIDGCSTIQKGQICERYADQAHNG